MIELKMRVVDKKGKVLGRVSTLGVYKSTVSYVNVKEDVVTVKYGRDVDLQCLYDGKWQTIFIPAEDDSSTKDDLRIMRNA